MKNFLKVIGVLIIVFYIVPLAVNFWVTIPSSIGFIVENKQDVWIGFYAALIGGGMTLLGVAWTIRYAEKNRKEDLLKREQELGVEFENREQEAKRTLAIQYKPILTVSYDANFPAEAKYEKFYTKNILGLMPKKFDGKDDEKRIVISLDLLNIGRGEANNLVIKSTIRGADNSVWPTEDREYEELYMSNKLNLMAYKALTEEEWTFYNNKLLNHPVILEIEVHYDDLVGCHHTLQSTVLIHKFINVEDENGYVSPNALALNSYDTTIRNVTRSSRI